MRRGEGIENIQDGKDPLFVSITEAYRFTDVVHKYSRRQLSFGVLLGSECASQQHLLQSNGKGVGWRDSMFPCLELQSVSEPQVSSLGFGTLLLGPRT